MGTDLLNLSRRERAAWETRGRRRWRTPHKTLQGPRLGTRIHVRRRSGLTRRAPTDRAGQHCHRWLGPLRDSVVGEVGDATVGIRNHVRHLLGLSRRSPTDRSGQHCHRGLGPLREHVVGQTILSRPRRGVRVGPHSAESASIRPPVISRSGRVNGHTVGDPAGFLFSGRIKKSGRIPDLQMRHRESGRISHEQTKSFVLYNTARTPDRVRDVCTGDRTERVHHVHIQPASTIAI